MAKKKYTTIDHPDFTSQQLAEALKAADVASVAFALRNDKVIVPLLDVAGPPQVRVFRRDDADKYMLLLFSSAANYVAMLPKETNHKVLAYDAASLKQFLDENIGVLEAVWFDVAGPHPMQAAPRDILDALELTP